MSGGPAPSPPPAIAYTDKDFASLRDAMFELAALRFPEWTDRSSADLGVLLVELVAYLGDVVSYHQDRLASEQFLATAVERRSVQDLLHLIGYELHPPAPATASLTLLLDEPTGDPTFTLARGATFETTADPSSGTPSVPFTYLGPDLTVDRSTLPVEGRLRRLDGVIATNCRRVLDERVGVSTGEPGQQFALAQTPVVPGSVRVSLDLGGPVEEWDVRDDLLFHVADDLTVVTSGPTSRDVTVRYGSELVPTARIVFGDGTYGLIPPSGAVVSVSYLCGGGTRANVAASTITQIKPTVPGLSRVTNPLPATGGADAESIEHARAFGPLAFRSGDRAVTLSDYVTIARQAGGVAKVRAHSSGWNRVDLYVGAEGGAFAPVDDDTKRRLMAYFEPRRMVGTSVRIKDATAVPIDITVEVWCEHFREPASVLDEVRRAVGDLVAYRNVDFGRPMYLSKVYEAVEALTGVAAAIVSRFRRADAAPLPDRLSGRLQALGLGDFQPAIDVVIGGALPAFGRIDIGEFEIAVPGDIEVVVLDSVARPR